MGAGGVWISVWICICFLGAVCCCLFFAFKAKPAIQDSEMEKPISVIDSQEICFLTAAPQLIDHRILPIANPTQRFEVLKSSYCGVYMSQ